MKKGKGFKVSGIIVSGRGTPTDLHCAVTGEKVRPGDMVFTMGVMAVVEDYDRPAVFRAYNGVNIHLDRRTGSVVRWPGMPGMLRPRFSPGAGRSRRHFHELFIPDGEPVIRVHHFTSPGSLVHVGDMVVTVRRRNDRPKALGGVVTGVQPGSVRVECVNVPRAVNISHGDYLILSGDDR